MACSRNSPRTDLLEGLLKLDSIDEKIAKQTLPILLKGGPDGSAPKVVEGS